MAGFGINLTLKANLPSWRPATGYMGLVVGGPTFSWFVAVPEGDVTGTYTLPGGVTKQFTGTGYHDHNWGNVNMAVLLEHWWWGRGKAGGKVVINAYLTGSILSLYLKGPLMYVADIASKQILVSEYGTDNVTVKLWPDMTHPDPLYPRTTIASGVNYTSSKGYVVAMNSINPLLMSVDLSSTIPNILKITGLSGLLNIHPWYTRFSSTPVLKFPNGTSWKGVGTHEYYEVV
ncbi:hypothetical protein HDU93_004451 [Gonapodya sp. JEL0774]|nr:hypothetical protein HDU93_004451 [Gonapodya sp. JEL0774]